MHINDAPALPANEHADFFSAILQAQNMPGMVLNTTPRHSAWIHPSIDPKFYPELPGTGMFYAEDLTQNTNPPPLGPTIAIMHFTNSETGSLKHSDWFDYTGENLPFLAGELTRLEDDSGTPITPHYFLISNG